MPSALNEVIHISNTKPISSIIRQRLQERKISFHANDTIHSCIKEKEIELLKEEVADKVQGLLNSLLIDIDNDHNSHETPKRIAKKYISEIFKGRYQAPPKITEFPNYKNLDEIYSVGPISVRSTCSHHFSPVIGQVWIGVDPGKRIIGLSKFNRIVDWVMSRPQIQEEAVVSLADYIEEVIEPKGLAIFMKAKHYCMIWRGVKDNDTLMKNLILRGTLKEEQLKFNFLEMIAS